TETAPSGVRGLDGQVQFRTDTLSACSLLEATVPAGYVEYSRAKWTSNVAGTATLRLQEKACAPLRLTTSVLDPFDLLVVERKSLYDTRQELGSAIVELVRRKQLGIFAVNEWAPYQASVQARANEVQRNLEKLRAGSLEGIGMLVLRNGVQVVCAAYAAD